MSPILDPRYAAKRQAAIEKEERDAQRAARMEYVKPLIMFAVGVTVIFIALFNSKKEDDSAGLLVIVYAVTFALELALGVAGLWVASSLWLGGAGPLGLCILRLAGIYAVTDVVSHFTSGLSFLSLLISGAVYVGLLMWLFELDPGESIMLALITFVLKMAAGFVIVLALTSH